ncbi:MAG: S8/S53 family peptidase [Opitutaceae bacterium]|nr:S8/S53 family peptidase [Opitutaceae bacterium]
MNQETPKEEPVGIDKQAVAKSGKRIPFNEESFTQIRVIETWKKYADKLSWGKGQCLAILDDGCELDAPQWQTKMEWGAKVIATHNSIDGNDDPTPVPPGYHGTTVGNPSSIQHDGVLGVAYNNFVAHVRCVSQVHLQGQAEAGTIARALRWVLENHSDYNITTVNLSPLDDDRHSEPVSTELDDVLCALRQQGIWVSAPCGNHGFTDGISWPACQPHCFGIGATTPGKHEAHLDRFTNTDLLVTAVATSSSNAYAAACSMILREAIEKNEYQWESDGETLPDAMMRIFQKTGVRVKDADTNYDFRGLDLFAAVDHVFTENRA